MDNKIKLFLDFDETLTKSIKQFVKLANKKFNVDKDYKKCKEWNFCDLYPEITLNDVNEIFRDNNFFVDLELYEDVYEKLKILNDKIEIHIATIGLKENLNNKKNWSDKELKEINYVFDGIEEDGSMVVYDKSSVDMSNSIFVDDRTDNLRSSNADVKILFKGNNNFTWQKCEPNECIYITNTWKEIYEIVNFFTEHPQFIKGANDNV